MHQIDPYNINHELEFSVQHSQRQFSNRSNQELTIRGSARNQFNGRHDDMLTLPSTDGKLILLHIHIYMYNIV